MTLDKAQQLLEKAQEWAKTMHKGQLYAGKDYYEAHIVPVADLAMEIARARGCSEAEVLFIGALAYLHDIVEDTDVTTTEVHKGFGRLMAELVTNLTKLPNDAWEDQWARALRHPHTTITKQADMLINLQTSIKTHNVRLIGKYTNGLRFLVE